MRIISGEWGGRRIHIPSNNWPTRPTTDRTREALFNILQHRLTIADSSVLDLYAGTGMISWECLSRGAKDVVLVEKHPKVLSFLRKQINEWNISDRAKLIGKDVFRFLAGYDKKVDLIFADPPYRAPFYPQLVDQIFEREILKERGWLIVEHSRSFLVSSHSYWRDTREYGQSAISFFSREQKLNG